MKKLLPAFALLIAPLTAFSQARLVINGTTPVYMVENGGVAATPIYIEINNPAANAITTTGTNGWIVSENEFNMVKWDLNNTAGTLTIPFGYSTIDYLPLTVNLTTIGNPPVNGGVKFSTWHTVSDNWTGVVSVSGPPTGVTNMHAFYNNVATAFPSVADNSWNVVDRFWVIDAAGYSSAPSVSAAGMTFSYIHAGANLEFAAPNIAADEGDLLVQRFNPGPSTWGDWLGPMPTQNSVGNVGTVNSSTVGPANFFRSWTLSNSINPLPITLSGFTVQCNSGTAFIQWTAETQLNNAYFTVEKTTDGVHFETVGSVNGAGTTTLPINYSIVDNSPYPGNSYYYLFQTDFDKNQNPAGDPILFTGCGTILTTTVNGYNTTNNIVVNINSIAYDNFNISLVNMLGQTITNSNHSVAIGGNQILLNNNIAPGIYILNVKNDKVNYTKKLVVGVK